MKRALLSTVSALGLVSLLAATNGSAETTPTFNYLKGDAKGCANVNVYKLNGDAYSATEATYAHVDVAALGFDVSTDPVPSQAREFRIEDHREAIQVQVLLKVEGGRSFVHLCNDIIDQGLSPDVWEAHSGSVRVELFDDSDDGDGPFNSYNATLLLEDVRFVAKDGRTVTLPRLDLKNAFVGWLAG